MGRCLLACASCGKNKLKGEGYYHPEALQFQPFNANDIQVYHQGNVRRMVTEDWPTNRHKLILFFPEVNTPVCETELGALNHWTDEFDKLGCDVYAATTDQAHAVKDWFESEELLKDAKYRVLSSYLLPTRLNLLNNGRTMRASVFITKDGDMVIQQHFMKVGRSLEELHRTLYAYTTGSYCGEGWTSPASGFLVRKDDNSATE